MCSCLRCDECKGSGTVWISFTGKYLGNHRCDDLDSLETCDNCGGSGILQLCDECAEIEMEQEAKNDERERLTRY